MHTYTTGRHNSVVVSAHMLQVREYSTPSLNENITQKGFAPQIGKF